MTDRNTQLRQSGDRAMRLVQRPHVGARWTPQHIVRQDSASGFYEELNAPSSRLSADAANLQTALLAPPRTSRIADVIVCTVMAVLLAAALVHWWSS